MSLHNNVVLVTGAFSGVGRALTDMLMAARAKVVGVGRKEDNTIPSYAGNYLPIERDLDGPFDAEDVLDFTLEKHGRIDMLINLAGSVLVKPLADYSHQDFARMLKDNFYSAVDLTQLLLPKMLERNHGTLVFVPSTPATVQPGDLLAYKASKYALAGYVTALKEELKDTAVRVVNAEFPGVDSTFWKRVSQPIDRSGFLTASAAALQIFEAITAGSAKPLPEPAHVG